MKLLFGCAFFATLAWLNNCSALWPQPTSKPKPIEKKTMATDTFLEFLEATGARRFGLCMFAPAIMSPVANRMLNEAYRDAGDNLSVPMGYIGIDNIVRYRAGNYSSADLAATKSTIDVLAKIPGAVLLITEAGVGASPKGTLGLLEHGQVQIFNGRVCSFYSFAKEHLSSERITDPSDVIEEFSHFGITISAQLGRVPINGKITLPSNPLFGLSPCRKFVPLAFVQFATEGGSEPRGGFRLGGNGGRRDLLRSTRRRTITSR